MTLKEKILIDRGYVSKEEQERFVSPKYEDLGDPFLFPDMERAIMRIHKAVQENEIIGIYTDYDCDGIPGGTLLYDFFCKIGYEKNITTYIPHRHDEGYGIHIKALDELKEKNVTLLITLDVGITAVMELAYAKSIGIDVILTDHHEPLAVLPEVYACINPKVQTSGYPAKDLCGTGVAFTLVRGFLFRYRDEYSIPLGWEKWLLDLVAIATISDSVPLVGENRILAWWGMFVFKKTKRTSLRVWSRLVRIPLENLTEEDIGFSLAPIINVASRLDTPRAAFDFLRATNISLAEKSLKELLILNEERKKAVARIMIIARARLEKRNTKKNLLVIGDPLWSPGVLGLISTKITEEYGIPSFVWGGDGEEILKGSCRAPKGYSVVDIMNSASQKFIQYGGHAGAGGFSILKTEVLDLEDSLVPHVFQYEQIDSIDAGIEYPIDSISYFWQINLKEIRSLAPYGMGHINPTLVFSSVLLIDFRIFGKQKNHLEMVFRDVKGYDEIRVTAFFTTMESLKCPLVSGQVYTLLGKAYESSFAGRNQKGLRFVSLNVKTSFL
jgi:single-stranded-DNA-specific exonuclease